MTPLFPPSTPGGWLLAAVVLALVAVTSRRPPWEGSTGRLWWREQRMHRRPCAVWTRLGRVLLAAALVLVASVVGLGAALAVAAALITTAAGALIWYGVTRAAMRVEPTTSPLEDGRAEFLLDLENSGEPFDRRVVDGDLALAPDPDIPTGRPEHYRAEIDI